MNRTKRIARATWHAIVLVSVFIGHAITHAWESYQRTRAAGAQQRNIARQYRATGGLHVADGSVFDGLRPVGPLKDARAEVSVSGQLDTSVSYTQRHTVTRFAAFGLFSLATPKKSKHVSTTDTRKVLLAVSGQGFTVIRALRPQDEEAARAFAAQVNTQGQFIGLRGGL